MLKPEFQGSKYGKCSSSFKIIFEYHAKRPIDLDRADRAPQFLIWYEGKVSCGPKTIHHDAIFYLTQIPGQKLLLYVPQIGAD